MNDQEIKEKALRTSESVLKKVESKAYNNNLKTAKSWLKLREPQFRELTEAMQNEQIREEMDLDINYYKDFIGGLVEEFNKTLLSKIEQKEKDNKTYIEVVDAYEQKLKEKDRIIDNMQRK